MNQYQPQGFSFLPVIVKNLLIINALVYVASLVFYYKFGINANDHIGLFYFESSSFRPYQILTHFFAHAFISGDGSIQFSHLFFNMFSLWMFGTAIENVWGPKRFLTFYVITAFGAAFLHTAVYTYEVYQLKSAAAAYLNNATVESFETFTYKSVPAGFKASFIALLDEWTAAPKSLAIEKQSTEFVRQLVDYKISNSNVVGASGAIYGILMAFGMLFPNALLYFFFFIPVKAKYAVIIFGAIALFSGIANEAGDNVAHFAHLGGMLFGFLLIKYWQRNRFTPYE